MATVDRYLAPHVLTQHADERWFSPVWVEGRQVVTDGEVTTIDVHRAAAEVTTRAVRLAGSSGSRT